jgi:ABC-2 type transport system permease protein
VGHLLPTAWAMDAFQDIITRGLDMQAILPEIAVLFGFAVVFLALSIRAFRYE